jgi:hypothetical protein
MARPLTRSAFAPFLAPERAFSDQMAMLLIILIRTTGPAIGGRTYSRMSS